MAKNTRVLTPREKKRLEKFGANIRAIREKKSLTLENVEDRGYPSWKHLQAVETGRKNITLTSLYRLADALGVEAHDLLRDIV